MRWVLMAVLAASVLLLVHVWPMPTYKDPAQKMQLDLSVSAGISGGARQSYYRAVRDLRTDRKTLMDLGLGLGSLSFTLLAGSFVLGLRRWGDLTKMASPKRESRFYLLGNLFWLALIPAGYIIYYFRYRRDDYPWFADSIVIPIVGQALLVIAGLPLLNIFFSIYASRGTHPAKILSLFPKTNAPNVRREIMFILLGAVNLYTLGGMTMAGDFAGIPAAVVLFYLLLSVRAGLINYQRLALGDSTAK